MGMGEGDLHGLEAVSSVKQHLHITRTAKLLLNYLELKRFVFNMYLLTGSNMCVFVSFERFGLP